MPHTPIGPVSDSARGSAPAAHSTTDPPGALASPGGRLALSVGDDRAMRRARELARTPAQQRGSARSDGRTRQGSLLVMAEIAPGRMGSLERLLAEIAEPPGGEDLEMNPILPFLRLRTVHFARILIHASSPSSAAPIPEWKGVPQASGPSIPAKLLFSTDFDGSLEDHVDELLREAGGGLDRIFSHCLGWPGVESRDAVHGFVLRHREATNAFYTGTMNRSVDQIRREAELRDRIEAFLDTEAPKPDFPREPLEIRSRIQQFVFSHPALAWAQERPGPSPRLLVPESWVKRLPVTVGVLVTLLVLAAVGGLSLFVPIGRAAALVLLPVGAIGVVAGVGFAYLSRLAARDPVIIRDSVKEHTAKLVETEDRIVQNEMSSVIYIKRPLWFRRTVLWGVLTFINFAARYLSNQGALVGIPSIHFARWVMVDGGRRLVFFSNFDGSWENYLGDFIDKAHDGLTSVWSNCVGFPRTKGLSQLGATDEQKFKAYSRDSQIRTQVWYSAYRWLTVSNINNNSRIRLGLYDEMSHAEAAAWLRRL